MLRGPLARFINDLFHEMPKVTRELAYAFQFQNEDHFPIDSTADEIGGRDRAKESLPSESLGLAMAADRSEVADAVASEILRLVRQDGVPLREIAILFRSRTHYRVYEKALSNKGIASHVYRGLGFFRCG